MKTQIQYVHCPSDKVMTDHIEDKLDKLNKIYNRIESCNIVLRHNKDSKNKNKVVEINMNIPGSRLFAKTQSESFEMAFEKVIDEIEKQLHRKKEKILAL